MTDVGLGTWGSGGAFHGVFSHLANGLDVLDRLVDQAALLQGHVGGLGGFQAAQAPARGGGGGEQGEEGEEGGELHGCVGV